MATQVGSSPARVDNIRLIQGEDVFLPKLHLRPLSDFALLLVPPVGPAGTPWATVLSRPVPLSNLYKEVRRQSVPFDGTSVFPGLETGDYELAVLDDSGNVRLKRAITITLQHESLSLDIPEVPVRGLLAAGKTPLKAMLVFRSAKGERVSLESSEDGAFEGSLPFEGTWRVDVVRAEKEWAIRNLPVLVRRAEGNTYARVDLKLSPTTLRGTVVNEAAQPVLAKIRARVPQIQGLVPRLESSSSEDGSFELPGVPNGDVTLEAYTKQDEAGTLQIQVAEEPPDPIRLVVFKRQVVRGRLVSTQGVPVAGAIVRAIAPRDGTLLQDTSGPDGQFSLMVPGHTSSLAILVVSLSFPIQISTVMLTETVGSSVDLVLGGSSGLLEVEWDRGQPWPSIRRNAAEFSLQFLLQPGDSAANVIPNGFAFVVEAMEYAVCPTYRSLAGCVEAKVPSGGTVAIRISKR